MTQWSTAFSSLAQFSSILTISVLIAPLATQHAAVDPGEEPRPLTQDDLLAFCGNTTEVPYTSTGSSNKSLNQSFVENRCDNSKPWGNRLLVTTTHAGNTSWMTDDIDIPYIVYHSGIDNNASHSHPNIANEAMGYLRFIAEYYDCLPEVTLFAHPHKSSYHTQTNLDTALKFINWDKIKGYSTLHPFGASWAEFNARDPIKNLEGKNMSLDNLNADCFPIINNTLYDYYSVWEYKRSQWMSKAFDAFFTPAGLGELPEKIRCATTAEFFVTREKIQLRPREFYVQAQAWISEAESTQLLSSWELGVVFELIWHYVFGEPAVMTQPSLKPCELYKCGLVQ